LAKSEQARKAEHLIGIGAQEWFDLGGWGEVHRRARGVLA
jgi:hypothetical protein